ncbi:hypothetical protein D9M70_603250 [compost metagenome]
MDVGDFLKLERAFHRHRELRTTAKEQGVVLLGEQFGDFLHGGVHRQCLSEASRQATQLFDQGRFDARRQRAANLTQRQGQQQQANQLRGEGFG